MNPDPFNTRARTGRPISTLNRRRSSLPAILTAVMAIIAIALALLAIVGDK